MGVLKLLWMLLPNLQRRNPSSGDTQQYTQQVIYTTSMGWTESYVFSYRSTEIITITSSIPCEVTTSYTTTYVCSDCSPCQGCQSEASTFCYSKSCSAGPSSAAPTPFNPTDLAKANVEDQNQNVIGTLQLPPGSCPAFYAFTYGDVDVSGLEPCNAIPQEFCLASPCIASVYETIQPGDSTACAVTITSGSVWPDGVLAPLATPNAQQQFEDAESCEYSTLLDVAWATNYEATESCGVVPNDNQDDTNYGTCGVSIISYAYVTNGQTIQTATTIPQHGCGPYNNLSGSATKSDTSGVLILLGLWTVTAVASAIGMLAL